MSKKKKYFTRLLSVFLVLVCLISVLAGCSVYTSSETELSYDEAAEELSSLLSKVDTSTNSDPILDIYSDDTSDIDALSDISAFPITVQGNGDINLEIAGATEMTSESSPDDWLNVVAERFNKSGYKVNINTVELTDKLVGNTAGILMENSVYEAFTEKYDEANLSTLITAAIAGDVTFAYPNPYTSTTGLNGIGAILYAFDPDNPLSSYASEQLREYQKTSPPVAYTTAVLRNQAAKGVINTMLMEEQAYINTPSLSDYTYIPFGVRHDHPVYTFDYCTAEEQEAAQLFVDYCLISDNQKLATEKGFNRHDDYKSQDPGFSGTDWINAQQIWKENKSGGKPIVAVFIADTSSSMDGEPLNSLKSALVNTSSYIGENNYIGLVSYNSDVTVNLPIAQFDATQKAYFTGEIKNLTTNGNTSTYDAVLVGLDMLLKAKDTVGDSKLMLFLLTDGQQNRGYSLGRVKPIVEGLQIPVYTIAYNYNDNGELEDLSGVNEAASLNAESDDIVNLLRNLFNVEM